MGLSYTGKALGHDLRTGDNRVPAPPAGGLSSGSPRPRRFCLVYLRLLDPFLVIQIPLNRASNSSSNRCFGYQPSSSLIRGHRSRIGNRAPGRSLTKLMSSNNSLQRGTLYLLATNRLNDLKICLFRVTADVIRAPRFTSLITRTSAFA